MFCWGFCKGAAAALLATLTFGEAVASVVINGTRIIYYSGDREITLKLNNNGEAPSLVQTWMDDGDLKETPVQSKTPFIISPPVFRIDSNQTQNLRMIFTGAELAEDRESIFWFNLLEVPAQKNNIGVTTNLLQMAFKSRIKVFYRPKSLKGTSSSAPEQIEWRVVCSYEECVLEAHNASEFYVTITRLTLIDGRKSYSADGEMIGPGTTHKFMSPELKNITGSASKIIFDTINDYGMSVVNTRPVSP